MDETKRTLIVKHLPSNFDAGDANDFLSHFGAARVRYMGNQGRLKHCAFVTFHGSDDAAKALKRLHQLQVANSTLTAEFSKPQLGKYHPKLLEDPPTKESNQDALQDEVLLKEQNAKRLKEKQLKYLDDINKMCTKWGIGNPFNPKLEYIYPAPTVSILTNIANALASHPSFYVQVLHLMNKMNIPPPFGQVTPSPPLAEETQMEVQSIEPVAERMESSEESELESDEEQSKNIPDSLKRPKDQSSKPRKKHKLQPILATTKQMKTTNPDTQVSKIFEQQPQQSQKKIELKLSTIGKASMNESLPAQTPGNVSFAPPDMAVLPTPVDILDVLNEKSDQESGGFGKIEPIAKEVGVDETQAEEEDWKETEFITFKELRSGRLSSEQMKDFSVFKSYSPGEPTTRLYIKNLAKQTTEEDLHRIFGRYIDWSSDEERTMFDIRLMKEGRMKGQAFITLANEEASVIAMKETNAFVLNNKPMVVQFARSAKPKEKDSSSK